MSDIFFGPIENPCRDCIGIVRSREVGTETFCTMNCSGARLKRALDGPHLKLPIVIAVEALQEIAALQSDTRRYPSRLEAAYRIAQAALTRIDEWR